MLRLVRMFMPVALGQMQQHPRKHQKTTEQHQPPRRPFTEAERYSRTDERCKGEHGASPRRPKSPLRQKGRTEDSSHTPWPPRQRALELPSGRAKGSPHAMARHAVAAAPSKAFAITTWLGSRSASPRDRVLSTPQATVAQ